MRKYIFYFIVVLAMGLPGVVAAADRGTADQAVALTKKAVAYIAEVGADTAYKTFTAKDPKFIDRDLYVTVYNMNGDCLAHGANTKLVGKNLLESQDTDGKFYIKDRITLAQTKQSFWQDYKFTNPTTRKIEPKSTYCQTNAGTIVCVGFYK